MSEHRRIRRIQRSNLLNKIRRDARKIREELDDNESQSGHASPRKSEGGGAVSDYESQEVQGQNEVFFVMSPKNGNTIYLTVTSLYDPVSVDNTDDELVSTRSPIETAEISSQSDTST